MPKAKRTGLHLLGAPASGVAVAVARRRRTSVQWMGASRER
jgi:hypothetical protein